MMDQPTAAQFGQVMERLSNLAEDVREVKASQDKANSMLITITSMQRDLVYLDEKVRQLFTMSDQRAPEVARIDKRLASVERWNKMIGTMMLASIGIVGWGVQRIEYLYKMDTRISMLELIVNTNNMERAISPDTPKEGKK